MPRYKPPPIRSLSQSYRTGLLVLDEKMQVLHRDEQLEQVVSPSESDSCTNVLDQLLEGLSPTLTQMHEDEETQRHNIAITLQASPEGRERTFIANAVRVQSDCLLWVIQMQDAEELERANRDMRLATRYRALARHYQAIAHDLKQPMVLITMYLQLLKDLLAKDRVPQDIQHKRVSYIEMIEEAAATVSDSLQSILSNLRETDEAQSRFVLNDVMERVLHFIGPRARVQNVTLESSLPGKNLVLYGNADRFRQVMINLCVNALEAMPTGGVMRVWAEQLNDSACLHVRDSGMGMDEQTARRAFTLHFSTKATGNGVGLNGVQSIVEQMGGRIEFETEPDEGTQFDVYLPVQPQDDPQKPTTP